MSRLSANATLSAGFLLLCLLPTGCASSIYGWQVRTNSTPMPPSFHRSRFEQEPVALFPAETRAALRGNEVALSYYLAHILHKVEPKWKIVGPQETATRINQQGLTSEYLRMKADYEVSDILDRDALRKIAGAIGARYVFQPRLVDFTQTMTDRWKFPGLELRMTQTRSSLMRLSLELWDAQTGELVWASFAEAEMQNEAVSQDPVYLADIAGATLGGLVTDFVHKETASRYTPLNTFLDDLITEAMPKEKKDARELSTPEKKPVE